VDVVDRLVGGGAIVSIGNRTGNTWIELGKAVRGPAIDPRRADLASYRGDDRTLGIGGASPIAGTPWIIRVAFSRNAVTAPARTFLSRMASMAAVFVALSVFTAYGLVGRIERRAAEVRALNATLQTRVAELGALSQELEAFSYSVSHDLRAPLRQVVGSTGMLERSAGPSLGERDLRHVRTISDAARRMGRLIDELLTFSRMERREMLHAAVDLSAMVDSLREDAMGDIGEREVNWTVHPLPVVQGDPSMLRQAFANLLSNALKYTGKRAVAEIEIGASRPPGEHVIYVRDNGVGFDMQHAGKLFGVFQRLHGAEEFEGTGVGLANVRRIVARHGGRVWAEGAVDRGATFFVSLPQA
jgi:light-regulated signal transduction histidine kinase (bacteriophytochrome)